MIGTGSQIAPEKIVDLGRSYTAVQNIRVEQLKRDTRAAESDTLHLTLPHHLGATYVIEAVLTDLARPCVGADAWGDFLKFRPPNS